MILFGVGYVRPESGIEVDRIVLRVLRECDLSPKQAALIMDEWDFGTASRGLNGLGPLDLRRLACLPSKFWWKFFRAMLAAILLREEHEQERRVS